MAASFSGGNELLYAVGEQDRAHLVVVAHGAERKDSRQLCEEVHLGALLGAALHRGTDVDEQEHRQFALLFEDFHVRNASARSDVPVDGAHFVAGLVFPVLGKGHAASLECTAVFSRKNAIAQFARGDFHTSHTSQEFSSVHQKEISSQRLEVRGLGRGPSIP